MAHNGIKSFSPKSQKFTFFITQMKRLFVDIKLALLLFGISLFIWYLPVTVPNPLTITNAASAAAALSAIAGVLASILGIVVAIMLLALGLMRRTYGAYAFTSFFQNKKVTQLFQLYIPTILISIFSVLTLEDPLSVKNINFIYLSLILFICSMTVLFPFSKTIITTTQSKARIKELVGAIDQRTIDRFGSFRWDLSSAAYIEAIEKNPIFILTEITVRAVKDGDLRTVTSTLTESKSRLLDLLEEDSGHHQYQRSIINTFLIIVRDCARQAIEQREQRILRMILNTIEEIHIYCAENKMSWYVLVELNETFEQILGKSVEINMENIAREGIWKIGAIFKQHLVSNIPDENEIWMLHMGDPNWKDTRDRVDKDGQWNNISHFYTGMLVPLIEKAIELENVAVVTSGILGLTEIASEIMRAPSDLFKAKLGSLQKTDLVRSCYYAASRLVLKSADKGLFSKEPSLLFDAFGAQEALEEKTNFSKIPLLVFSGTLIELTEKEALDSFHLNLLGTIGRGNVRKIDDDKIFVEALILIIEAFNKIRRRLENKKTMKSKRAYLEVRKQVESIQRWMKNEKKHNSVVEQNLSSVLSSFSKLNQLKREDEGAIIKWPTLE